MSTPTITETDTEQCSGERRKYVLNNGFIESIQTPDHGQVEYWDAGQTGLVLRVGRRDKVWQVVYRVDGVKRRKNVGKYPSMKYKAAAAAAGETLAGIRKGADPVGQAVAAKSAPTFGDLAAEYLSLHAIPKKRSYMEDVYMLSHDLLPAWGTMKAQDISPEHVIELMDKIKTRGSAVRANRVHSLVSKMFKFGCGRVIDGRRMVTHNPARDVVKDAESPRDRVLSYAEIRTIWKAIEVQPPMIATIFKLGVLLGQRKSEITGMKWGEINTEDGAAWWTISAERSKNGQAHRVPLTPEVLELIESRRGRHPIYVFPSDVVPDRPVGDIKKPINAVRKSAGLDQDWHFHDLRRTFATTIKDVKIEDHVVSALLNHTPRDVTRKVYALYKYSDEKRDALVKWTARLIQIVGIVPNVVVADFKQTA